MFLTWLLSLSALASATLTIDGSEATRSFTCEAGQAVIVQGSSLTLTFSGDCGSVTVRGSTNHVTLDGVSQIRVEGASNTVEYARNLSGSPKLPVVKVGSANKVRAK